MIIIISNFLGTLSDDHCDRIFPRSCWKENYVFCLLCMDNRFFLLMKINWNVKISIVWSFERSLWAFQILLYQRKDFFKISFGIKTLRNERALPNGSYWRACQYTGVLGVLKYFLDWKFWFILLVEVELRLGGQKEAFSLVVWFGVFPIFFFSFFLDFIFFIFWGLGGYLFADPSLQYIVAEFFVPKGDVFFSYFQLLGDTVDQLHQKITWVGPWFILQQVNCFGFSRNYITNMIISDVDVKYCL